MLFDPSTLLLDSSLGVTIYDEQFELVSWNKEYSDLGITPKSDLREGLNLRNTYSIAYCLGVFDNDPSENADKKFQLAQERKSPEQETLCLPSGGTVVVRRIFLHGIGVAAIFVRPRIPAHRRLTHLYHNQMTKVLLNLELATISGDTSYLERAKKICLDPIDELIRSPEEIPN